jgi:hypothetical protein
MTTNTTYRAGWGLVILLAVILSLLLGLSNRAGAEEPGSSEFTWVFTDMETGDRVELLRWGYFTRADEAANCAQLAWCDVDYYAGLLADAERARRGAK